MTNTELTIEIEKQRKINIALYEKFQYKLQEKEMQPIIQQWREGSTRLKELIKQFNKQNL